MSTEETMNSIFNSVQTWGWGYVLTFVVFNIFLLGKIVGGNIRLLVNQVGLKKLLRQWLTGGSSPSLRGTAKGVHLRGASNGGVSASPSDDKLLFDAFVVAARRYLSSTFSRSGPVPLWQAMVVNAVLVGVLEQRMKQMFTEDGVSHAFALGSLLWSTTGWRGWFMCAMSIVCEHMTIMTKFKEKDEAGIAAHLGGLRGPEKIWGCFSAPLLLAACSVLRSVLGVSQASWRLAYIGSLSAWLADVFAGELGKAYGKKAYLVTSWQNVSPGTRGAVSLAGTAAAFAGSSLIGTHAYVLQMITVREAVIVSGAGFLVSLALSVLCAMRRCPSRCQIGHDTKNFCCTVSGAGLTVLCATQSFR